MPRQYHKAASQGYVTGALLLQPNLNVAIHSVAPGRTTQIVEVQRHELKGGRKHKLWGDRAGKVTPVQLELAQAASKIPHASRQCACNAAVTGVVMCRHGEHRCAGPACIQPIVLAVKHTHLTFQPVCASLVPQG